MLESLSNTITKERKEIAAVLLRIFVPHSVGSGSNHGHATKYFGQRLM
jgi:hypothetical protein